MRNEFQKTASLLALAAAALVVNGCLSETGGGKVRLAAAGRALTPIVTATAPTAVDKRALSELETHLEKITGADFAVIEEKAFKGDSPAIYLGRTRFAANHGIDSAKLGEEEWAIRSVGDSLVLSGGQPRGTLYAVYEFLESRAGCHWLAWDTEVIPRTPDLTVGDIDVRGRPAFFPRDIYAEAGRFGTGEARKKFDPSFLARNRCPRNWNPSWGGGFTPYGRCHSFYYFVNPKEWFAKHPEYYSMDAEGKRIRGNPDVVGNAGSELCLSNPDLPKVMADSVSRHIKGTDAQRLKAGLPISRVVDVGQEDNALFICKCPECAAITQAEGSESGLLIKFLNKVSDILRKEYPDIQLRTLCYVNTDAAPLITRPNDNVIPWWCDLYGKSDCFRPITHPVNREQAEALKGWSEIAENLHVWDYWNKGGTLSSPAIPEFVSPETTAETLRFFRDNNVRGVFIEFERGVTNQSFFALSYWAGLQLLVNPNRSPNELTDTFMKGYYGPAATAVREYYDFLSGALRDEPTAMNAAMPASGRKYLTMDFLTHCRTLLLKAETKTAPDTHERVHVWRELIVVYNCALHNWSRMKRAAGRDFPMAKNEVLDKYETMREAIIAYDQYGPEMEKTLRDDLRREMTSFRNPLPLPEQFRKLPEDKVMDFAWPKLPHWALVDAPDATGGRALVYRDSDPKNHERPPVFGVYDRASKRLGETRAIANVPDDEKYHLYKIARFSLGSDTIVWGHSSWRLCCAYLATAYVCADGVMGADPNLWDIYVSAKITGPAYVKGSKKENAIWCDRVILVRPAAEMGK